MGFIFNIFTKTSGFLAIIALALAISSGLYILAELCEEFPSIAGKCIRICLYVVIGIHILLLFDGVPFYSILGGIACQACYALMMRKFPFIEFVSIPTFLSLIACVCSHVIWFRYFMDLQASHDHYYYGSSTGLPDLDMLQIVGFFLIMVWLIPCGLFVSLTISDNSLPISSNISPLDGDKTNVMMPKKVSIFKSLYDKCQSMLEQITRSKLSASNLVESRKNARMGKYA